MKRATLNYLVDWFAFVLITALAGTGLLLHFKLPPGSGNASTLGMTRHEWGDVHFWIAVGLSAAVLLHLLLHAKWIKALTLGTTQGAARAGRAWGGIVAACLLLALAISPIFWPVTPGSGRGRNARVTADEASHDTEH